jgi:predicted O-linked N-acetylglucosamine transferase (SPINDLY family)
MVKISNSNVKKSIEFINQSKLGDAVLLLRKVLRNNPREIQALNILGQVLIKQEEFDTAIDYLQKSLTINSNDYEIWARLAYAYEKKKLYDKALEAYKQSLALNPQQAHVYDCLGRVLAKMHRDYEALPYFFKALEFSPNDVDIHNNIGFTSKKLGLYEMALKHYEIAMKLDPNNSMYLSSLIFNLHKDPKSKLQDFYKYAKEFYKTFVEPTQGKLNIDIYARLNTKKTKLRLGFVSADLCQHPVSAYLIKVLEKINRQNFELYFYSANEHQDSTTEQIKALSDKFESITELEDIQAAELIASDKVDVLFDMSGFTKGARNIQNQTSSSSDYAYRLLWHSCNA